MRRAARALLCVIASALTTNAAQAEVKIVDQSAQLVLRGARVEGLALTATWARRNATRVIPVADRGLLLSLRSGHIAYPDCGDAGIAVVADGARLPTIVRIERGGVNCAEGEGAEEFWLQLARPDVATLARSQQVSVDLCGTQVTLEPRTLTSLRKLLQRALAER